jgi:CheY-like chemotaxis protein
MIATSASLAGVIMPEAESPELLPGMDVVILCAQEEVRDVLAYWFRSLPVETTVADDGYQASRVLENAQAALLVTDRVIPPWPGLATFMGLRARFPKLRIAFVENGNSADWILARVTGAGFLLSRPLTRQAVVDVLTQHQAAL